VADGVGGSAGVVWATLGTVGAATGVDAAGIVGIGPSVLTTVGAAARAPASALWLEDVLGFVGVSE
jgi:hypothetical protein